MKSLVLRIAGLGVILVLAVLGFVAYRSTMAPSEMVDAAEILSPVMAEDGGTEPSALPAAPVLKSSAREPGRAAFDFGYKVGKTTYAYRVALSFPPDVEKGTMDLGVAKDRSDSLDQFPTDRHWSESRKAYYVAVSHDLKKYDVPSLCVRAVIGPTMASLDLSQASLCVMQRDQDGRCHPTTLACGLLRAN